MSKALDPANPKTKCRPDWAPFPDTPQVAAFNSNADILGYGGAAGGGKTGLLIGCGITQHHKAIIFRREYTQLKEIIDQARDLIATAPAEPRFNANDLIWRFDDGGMLELGAVKDPGDWQKFRGRPHDFVGFDEADQFLEIQVRALLGWMRTVKRGQRCRAILGFNPPTSQDGMWIIRFFGPWLDPEHPNPAAPGEIRWFAMVDEQEIEVESGEPFEHKARNGRLEVIRPLSRTFIPARLEDNPRLRDTNYGAVLDSLPEPLRSMLRHGSFEAGLEVDPWQVLPTAWVQAAQRRWHEWSPDPANAVPPEGSTLSRAGMDVAHGGKDKTVIAPRYIVPARRGWWVAPLAKIAGADTPDGKTAAAECVKVVDRETRVNVDAIGYGASAAERLADRPPEGYGLDAVAVNVAAGSEMTDRSGKFKMRNLRAEMMWRLREALDPEGDWLIALPPDPELLADLCAARFEITTQGIKVEAKDEIKERLGRSPDCGDAVALAMLPPPPIARPARAGGPGPVIPAFSAANPTITPPAPSQAARQAGRDGSGSGSGNAGQPMRRPARRAGGGMGGPGFL